MEAPFDKLIAHCQGAKFTGILRMRAKEGIGEVWFLSGIADEMQFGTSEGDEAMDRMRKATDATYELVERLPHPGGGFKKRFPAKGSVEAATPVTLMRYAERYALTCTLAVESKHVLVEAMYEMGELVSVETTADDDGITAMLEATEGTYEFKLPNVELPEGTPVLPPASASIMESIPPPEPLGVRALIEIKPAAAAPVGRAPSDEAEVKRKTVEIARQKKSGTMRAAVPRPVTPSKPVPAPEIKEAPKPVVVETKPVVEEKPVVVEAKPVVEEKKEEPPKEEPPKAKEPEKPKEPEKAEPKEEEEEEEEEEERESVPPKKPAKAPVAAAPQSSSLPWLVLPLLFAIAVVYLLWTNRM